MISIIILTSLGFSDLPGGSWGFLWGMLSLVGAPGEFPTINKPGPLSSSSSSRSSSSNRSDNSNSSNSNNKGSMLFGMYMSIAWGIA